MMNHSSSQKWIQDPSQWPRLFRTMPQHDPWLTWIQPSLQTVFEPLVQKLLTATDDRPLPLGLIQLILVAGMHLPNQSPWKEWASTVLWSHPCMIKQQWEETDIQLFWAWWIRWSESRIGPHTTHLSRMEYQCWSEWMYHLLMTVFHPSASRSFSECDEDETTMNRLQDRCAFVSSSIVLYLLERSVRMIRWYAKSTVWIQQMNQWMSLYQRVCSFSLFTTSSSSSSSSLVRPSPSPSPLLFDSSSSSSSCSLKSSSTSTTVRKPPPRQPMPSIPRLPLTPWTPSVSSMMQTWIHPPTGHWHQDSPLLMAQHLHQLSAWMHDTHRVLPGTGMFLVMAITECLCHHQWTFINSLCRVFHTAYLLSFTMHDLPRDSLWGCPFFTSDLIRCWSREMSTVDWMAWMEWLWKYQCEPYANRTQWSAWISASSASWTAVHSPSQWMARWIGLWGQSGSTWIECGHEKWMDFQQHPTPSNLTFQLYHWIVNMWTHYPHRWIINSGGMIPRWLLSYL